MHQDIFSIKNVNFAYRADTPVLQNISFRIKDNDFTGIIGPNGSGKSTLFKLMSGFVKPQHGQIFLKEKLLSQWKPRQRARQFAVLEQNPQSHLQLTVEEMVILGRYPYQKKLQWDNESDNDAVEQAMDLAQVTHLKNRYLNELSGGERQKTFIARALCQQPDILLLDEPTLNLDIHHQVEILKLLNYLNKTQKLTIIIISHNLVLASQYCRRIIILHNKSIFKNDLTKNVMNKKILQKVYGNCLDVIIKKGIPIVIPEISD